MEGFANLEHIWALVALRTTHVLFVQRPSKKANKPEAKAHNLMPGQLIRTALAYQSLGSLRVHDSAQRPSGRHIECKFWHPPLMDRQAAHTLPHGLLPLEGPAPPPPRVPAHSRGTRQK